MGGLEHIGGVVDIKSAAPSPRIPLVWNAEERLWTFSSEGFPFQIYVCIEEQRKLSDTVNTGNFVKVYISFLTCEAQILAYLFLQDEIDGVTYEESNP